MIWLSKFIAFIVLSIFATYMESAISLSKVRTRKVIPISNQLPA